MLYFSSTLFGPPLQFSDFLYWVCGRFDQLLLHLAVFVAKGAAAVEYIKKIDETLYTGHAFPLPRFRKICSKPAEQANSSLLAIREFAPLKLLIEIWYYEQQYFNERRAEAMAR